MATNETVGIIISAAIVVGSFATLMIKAIKPINDLNISIVKLTAKIDDLFANDKIQDERIKRHGKEIDELKMESARHEVRLNNLEGK